MSRRSIAAAAAALLLACGTTPTDSGAGPGGGNDPAGAGAPHAPARDTTPVRLLGLGVAIAPYDSATGTAGDFDLTLPLGVGPVGFVGRPVVGQDGATKYLHELDFFVRPGTLVRAPIDGVVAWVQAQPASGDFEILLRPSAHAAWAVSLDHLSRVQVDSGAVVRAGDVLGVVRTISSGGPAPRDVGFVELMVVDERRDTAWCPLAVAHPSKSDSLQGAVRALVAAWRGRGAATPDTSAMVLPGCWRLSGPSF